MKNIIIQAGGKGSRLELLTKNRPKCLVPVDNLPMIFHLFKKYPDAQFTIIADYKKEILKKYLKTFAVVKYNFIETNNIGTCSGIKQALKFIPNKEPFMLIWCDLILSNKTTITADKKNNYIGISKKFECRWSYKNNKFVKVSSKQNGVAGLFLFKNKSFIEDVPIEGEFVQYLSNKNIRFKTFDLYGVKEIGTILSYFQNELNKPKTRPFNKIEFFKNRVIKTSVDKQGEKLALDEIAWYKKICKFNFKDIPQIYNFLPLTMEKIQGENIYFYSFLTHSYKKAILEKIINAINNLHNIQYNSIVFTKQQIKKDCYKVYVEKTFERLSKIQNLVPFAKDEYITINNIKCKNIFYIKDSIIKNIKQYFPKQFNFIHGDCTFSNIILKTEGVEPILIDPRGYFGSTKFYGDKDYDWAKLYYSIVGDYDQFNRKNFSLNIGSKSIELAIMSNNWKDCENYFFNLISQTDNSNIEEKRKKIKLLHALIWLSLTTYTWEDYDSICGAFYNGLLYLRDYLNETK
ncbi:NTP transferase domain-containing protein [Candidatus Ruminimicrobium bovinum]|uniref:NTP transferase domain-containing protein n=1 Tax=Candidatus Ruminimicrobium bovinum TaxID=3242779 RepID=UPI0039B9710B